MSKWELDTKIRIIMKKIIFSLLIKLMQPQYDKQVQYEKIITRLLQEWDLSGQQPCKVFGNENDCVYYEVCLQH